MLFNMYTYSTMTKLKALSDFPLKISILGSKATSLVILETKVVNTRSDI